MSLFKPTDVSGAVPASFGTPLANLVSIDGSTTTGMQTGSNKTNSVTLTGYGPTAGVPPVSSFTNAVLTVRHSEVTRPGQRGHDQGHGDAGRRRPRPAPRHHDDLHRARPC